MSRPMADTAKRRARAGSSMTTSKPRPSGWCSTRARASARRPRSRSDRIGAAPLGRARPGRSHAGQDRADDGRARGARPAPQRESRAADGARNPKKSRGLLREAPAVKFAWIAAEKAQFPSASCVGALARHAERLLRLVRDGRSRPTRSGTGGSRSWSARRSTRASTATAARAFTRTWSSRTNRSAASASSA